MSDDAGPVLIVNTWTAIVAKCATPSDLWMEKRTRTFYRKQRHVSQRLTHYVTIALPTTQSRDLGTSRRHGTIVLFFSSEKEKNAAS